MLTTTLLFIFYLCSLINKFVLDKFTIRETSNFNNACSTNDAGDVDDDDNDDDDDDDDGDDDDDHDDDDDDELVIRAHT